MYVHSKKSKIIINVSSLILSSFASKIWPRAGRGCRESSFPSRPLNLFYYWASLLYSFLLPSSRSSPLSFFIPFVCSFFLTVLPFFLSLLFHSSVLPFFFPSILCLFSRSFFLCSFIPSFSLPFSLLCFYFLIGSAFLLPVHFFPTFSLFLIPSSLFQSVSFSAVHPPFPSFCIASPSLWHISPGGLLLLTAVSMLAYGSLSPSVRDWTFPVKQYFLRDIWSCIASKMVACYYVGLLAPVWDVGHK